MSDSEGPARELAALVGSHKTLMIVAVVALSLVFTTTGLKGYAVFDHAAIMDGEWWRLVSGHLAHTGVLHWFMNAAVFTVLWFVFGEYWRGWHGIMLLAGIATAISLGLLIFNPQVAWYAGLSGVIHGLLATGSIQQAVAGKSGYLVLTAGLAGKLVYEQLYGALPLSVDLLQVPVIYDAHLYGAVAGVLAVLLAGVTRPADASDT